MSEEENKPEEHPEQSTEPVEPAAMDKLAERLARISKSTKHEKLGFADEKAFEDAQSRFAQQILCQEKERLREQPSKSSNHNLALQQSLGRLAEIVFHGREFLGVWGAKCTPVDFLIQVELEDENGRRVRHGIRLLELVASIQPCGEEYANNMNDLVLQSLRSVSWTLANITKYAADVHAKLEKELFKDTSETEAQASTSGDSNLGVG